MKVRDLERLLAAHGVSESKMDATTRKLRDSGRLPMGGRGLNAPEISARDAAIVLLAIAGSAKAVEADRRVEKLEGLTRSGSALSLLDELIGLLSDSSRLAAISEVRVSRTQRRAAIICVDGRVHEFQAAKSKGEPKRFYVEGVLSRELIELVARSLGGRRK